MHLKKRKVARSNRGFTLIELMVATALFTIITGIVFAALIAAQARYKSEKSLMGSFQQANVAIDQMTRDIHAAGYPPAIVYNSAVSSLAANANKFAVPVAWFPGYTANAPCTIGATCTTPSSWDLILEGDLGDGNGVQWIRYQLQGTTLLRTAVRKTVGSDPKLATDGSLTPYLENVVNNASAAQIAAIRTQYPAMFPGGAPVPVFTYPTFGGPLPTPPNIRNINVTLIVQAPDRDPQSRQLRVATLTGQASTVN